MSTTAFQVVLLAAPIIRRSQYGIIHNLLPKLPRPSRTLPKIKSSACAWLEKLNDSSFSQHRTNIKEIMN